MKRLLTLLIVAASLLGTICLYACTSDTEGLSYEKQDNVYVVVKFNNKKEEITVPGEYSGMKVTSIEEKAFNSCDKVTKVVLSEGIASIGNYAFRYCRKMTAITLPSTLTEIGEDAFYACEKLQTVTVPEKVTEIKKSTFRYCSSLTEVTLPAGITSIGRRAFFDCPELTSIHFAGTISQWEQIEKGEDWDDKTPIYTVHCSDGDMLKK